MKDCKCSQCNMRDQCDKYAIKRRMNKVDEVMDKITKWHEMQELCKTLDRVDGFKVGNDGFEGRLDKLVIGTILDREDGFNIY